VVDPGLFIQGGSTELLQAQVLASTVTLVYAFIVSYVIAKIIQATIGLRATDEQQDVGLDQSLHAETAYSN
jgi:Amt family ammonium transporter